MRHSSRGFTIIETMIVLAVAALILLVIFLVVPGFQRNFRNNQRHADANKILAGINVTRANTPKGMQINSCTGNQSGCWVKDYPLNQFDSTSINVYWIQTTGYRGCLSGCVPVPSNLNQLYVYNWLKCTNGAPDWTSPGINDGTVTAIWYSETPGGTTQQCLESSTSILR